MAACAVTSACIFIILGILPFDRTDEALDGLSAFGESDVDMLACYNSTDGNEINPRRHVFRVKAQVFLPPCMS